MSVAGMSAAVLFALHGSAVRAEESPFNSLVALGGFGTLGLVYSSEDQADYVAGQFRPSGAGHSDTLSYKVDSRLGAQLDAALTDRWSAVVQVILEQRHDNSYKPTVEWANVRYALHPDFSVRIGRIVLPTFIVADTRKVGYANPWIRPPPELYALSPLTSSDGAELSLRLRAGPWTHTTEVTYGRLKVDAPDDVTVEARALAGVFQTAEVGALTLRASHVRGEVELDTFNPLFEAFRSFGPAGEEIANRYSIDGNLVTVWAIGVSYQPYHWFVMAEMGKLDTRSLVGVRSARYVSVGRRFASITPYVTYARTRRDDETSTPGLDTASLPPEQAPFAAALNEQLNFILGSTPQQTTLSAGLRWDFKPRWAFKLQFDHVDITPESPGMFSKLQPDHEPGGNANLIGVSLDFVF
jgi:hypothetical protein